MKCICTETVVGKVKCPVHGKHPAVMIGAIDDKRDLLGWLAATEHNNLVMRVVDVLELRNEHQDWLLSYVMRVKGTPVPYQAIERGLEKQGKTRKQFLLHEFPTGWLVLPFDKLLETMDMGCVQKLQEIIFAYRGIRLEKGEPNKIEPCDKCAGKGCKHCGGEGQIITFLETSAEERELMKGGV